MSFAWGVRRCAVGLCAIVVASAGLLASTASVASATGPELSINSVSILEGTARAHYVRFTASLSAPAPSTVSARFETVAGSAHAGSDFVAKSGAFSIARGHTAAAIDVAVRGDSTKEPDERFTVVLSSPTGATLERATGTGTILNDDPAAPGTRVRISSASIVEGNSGNRPLWFTVSLSAPSSSPVSVHYATVPGSALAGNDFSPIAGAVTIPAGQLTAFVSVPVTGDVSFEPTETFSVTLSGAKGATIAATAASGTGTILDDDPAPFNAHSWGDDTFGALGDPAVATERNATPRQVDADTNWASVATSGSSSIATKTDGTLWAWGNNFDGELGDGTFVSRTVPEQIGHDTDWAHAAIGSICALAIKTNGTLWAWGSNGNGQLGDGTNTDHDVPEQVGTATNWASVAVGDSNTFAIRTDGTLWGWGLNFQGTLGDGGLLSQDTPEQIGTDNHWVTLSTTDADTLAIKTDGTLWGWGNNFDGELGDGTGLPRSTPVQIGVDTHWATVRVGGGSAVATKTDGTLWAWGANGSGQLGDGTASATAVLAPERIGAGTDWASATTDGSSSLGVRTSGTLWAWGSNTLGELGDGGTLDQHAPERIGLDSNWSRVDANAAIAALRTDGTMWVWGRNDNSWLLPSFRTSPGPVATPGSWRSVALSPPSGGGGFAVGVKADGTLWAWGDNSDGQLGDGTTTDRILPAQVGADTHWAMVAVGSGYVVALKTDGTLWAWGNDADGELGDAGHADAHAPKRIGGDANWVTVSSSGDSTYAIKTNGSLWSWGKNAFGALGDGTTIPRGAPERIGAPTGWKTVVGGAGDAFAIRTDGSLWAWGYGGGGQLGTGSFNNGNAVPKRVGGATNWKTVAASGHTAAIKTDGTLWAWGYNGDGALGDGTRADRAVPERIGTATNWDAVAAGDTFTVALRGSHSLWAWGANTRGQLGNGSTAASHVPVRIGRAADWDQVVAGGSSAIALSN